MLIAILCVCLFICLDYLGKIIFGDDIKPIKRKQRIIETVDRGNNKYYIIQQKTLYGWFNAYETKTDFYSGSERYILKFVSYNQAKNKLENFIKEKTHSNLKKYNKKVMTTRVVAVTEKKK
jgi:Iap family predicted aminopeptidase